MIDRDSEGDAASVMLERRWFASMTAVRAMRAECEALGEVMEMSRESWRRARKELARLESLCDALGEELSEGEGRSERESQDGQWAPPPSANRPVSSAVSWSLSGPPPRRFSGAVRGQSDHSSQK